MVPDRVTDSPGDESRGEKIVLRRRSVPLLYAYDARTFLSRLRGLQGIPPLGPRDALIIRPCRAIHTFGLKERIDVVFMNRYGVILKLATVAPRRTMMCWRASAVVEMACGTATRIGLCVGQQFVPQCGGWT